MKHVSIEGIEAIGNGAALKSNTASPTTGTEAVNAEGDAGVSAAKTAVSQPTPYHLKRLEPGNLSNLSKYDDAVLYSFLLFEESRKFNTRRRERQFFTVNRARLLHRPPAQSIQSSSAVHHDDRPTLPTTRRQVLSRSARTTSLHTPEKKLLRAVKGVSGFGRPTARAHVDDSGLADRPR
uniref:Uncharacterized protein n=1 Tax=Plectus sambesii TaxID=2011161 RepID=A0A914WL77_9BILA